ncbi:MAG: hypothetical protein Q9182_005619 [Xanthomendoza sp. 2 TL-2023]
MAEGTSHGLDPLLSKAKTHIREIRLGKPHWATLGVDVDKDIRERNLISLSKQCCQNVDSKSDEAHEYILAGEAYLRNAEIDPSVQENQIAITQLRDWIINLISPSNVFAQEAPHAAESTPLASTSEVAGILSIKVTGLYFLSHLQCLYPSAFSQDPANLAACLASFTDLQNPWTNEESFRLARLMLSKHLAFIKTNPKDFDTLIADLLLDNIKPLFLKSRSSLLTSQARKAISPLPGPAGPSDFESGSKPWKFESPHIVTVLQWTLSQLDAGLVEKHWPLIIPPLLTILDDVSVAYKIRGCQLLDILLTVTPSSLLERSGLGEVFHNTLLPYLLYLPTLTPEEESLPLLNATYNTLITLTQSRFPASFPRSSTANPQKIQTLSAIFRYGILKSHTHIGENVRVCELLMRKSANLVPAMGIHSVKHLKDILPIITGTLTSPFATAAPTLLMATLGCLKAVIVNGWPRVRAHRGEMLEGLVTCWIRIADEDEIGEDLCRVKAEVAEVWRAVVEILKGDEEVEAEMRMLRECDNRLETLFAV